MFWEKGKEGIRTCDKKKSFNYLEQEHVLKSKDFRLNVHGTKGRCELCMRVAESLYSALFFLWELFPVVD